MKNKIVLSFIVPCYNVKPYLDVLFESLITCNEQIEIIIVDDGSSDGSSIICDNFAKDKMNTVVIHKKNGGLSSARNVGLEVAKGDYIWFVDSDDYIDNGFLSDIIKRLVKEKSDVICFNTKTITEGGHYIETIKRGLEEEKNYSGLDMYQSMHYPYSAVQFNFFKRDFLIKNSLKFKIGAYYDDWQFILRAYALMDSCFFFNITPYYYRLRHNSISTSKKNFKHLKDCVDTACDYIDFINSENLSNLNMRILHYGVCKMIEDAFKISLLQVETKNLRKECLNYFFSKKIWVNSMRKTARIKTVLKYCIMVIYLIFRL